MLGDEIGKMLDAMLRGMVLLSIVALVSVPLAIWKLAELFIWICT